MKKKLIVILLALSIPLSMISCSDSTNNANNTNNESSTTSTTSDNNTSSQSEATEEEVTETEVTEEETPVTEVVEEENTEASNEAKEESVKIYYYDGISDKIVYVNSVIKANEDNAPSALITELKNSPNEDVPASIASDITLNSCTVDKENSLVTLDFSSNFVEAQNLGSGAESKTLTAICNTFGNYFNVENVIITLDGKPYSSGHILMNEGESFKVDLNNATELK